MKGDRFDLNPPGDIDWQIWLDRHDRMQKRYVVMRDERFRLMARLIRETQTPPVRVLDLGCGAGVLLHTIRDELPAAEVVGLDLDPTVLWLAAARLGCRGSEMSGPRSRLLRTDFLDPAWPEAVGGPLAAVISSQTCHMLGGGQLKLLYGQIAAILRPGGIFLCADHARSDSSAIQALWERQRQEARPPAVGSGHDDWHDFWDAYAAALGVELSPIHEHLYGRHEGYEKERLPLSWHLGRLLESGFDSVECFWRQEYDVVYGGVRGGPAQG